MVTANEETSIELLTIIEDIISFQTEIKSTDKNAIYT